MMRRGFRFKRDLQGPLIRAAIRDAIAAIFRVL